MQARNIDEVLGSSWAILARQITIVRETTSHENTGEAGASCVLLGAIVDRYCDPAPPPALARRLALVMCALLAWACGAVDRQLRIDGANACIERQCHAEQGKARQECTTSCLREYGPK